MTHEPGLASDELSGLEVWRIGHHPFPWRWVDWRYAEHGIFTNRWDDPDGRFRVAYAASSLRGALLEVLAQFRVDPQLDESLAEIDDDPAYPTQPAGVVRRSWFDRRSASSALLSGRFCQITRSETIRALRPHFLATAKRLGHADFDAAVLRDAVPRQLTRAVSAHLYAVYADLQGIAYRSRHGDEEKLWAVWEQPTDVDYSQALSSLSAPAPLADGLTEVRDVLDFFVLRVQ